MNRDKRQNHTNKNNSKPQRILTMAVKTFLACRHVFFTHMIWGNSFTYIESGTVPTNGYKKLLVCFI